MTISIAKNKLTRALKIFKEIKKGEGAFNRDQKIHAENCIENMRELASVAITMIEDTNMTGEQLYTLWEQVNEEDDTEVDPWEQLDEDMQLPWNKLAALVKEK